MGIFGQLFQSNGLKRSIGVIAFLAAHIPQLAPFAPLLNQVGIAFGGVGLVHAVADKLLGGNK